MRKMGLSDATLCGPVPEMEHGLIDADLGGLVKKRVALPGRGKRGGARTIVATNRGDRWFFLYGFGKNERANIDRDELRFFQEVAKELVGLDAVQITAALSAGEIVEICYGDEEAQEPYSRRNA
ncbi:MAG: type II toxin-antitoxin system RelE/ParE family toxin [Gammaproteobacteria bacterium]